MTARPAIITILLAALALHGCREDQPTISAGANPADAGARAAKVPYQPVTAGARDYRIVQPKPWGQLNQDVTPKAK